MPTATVEIAPSAVRDLDGLLATRELPPDARGRVLDRLSQLETFPRSGPAMPADGPWKGARVLTGPWWFITIYEYDHVRHVVGVLAILDARTATRERGR